MDVMIGSTRGPCGKTYDGRHIKDRSIRNAFASASTQDSSITSKDRLIYTPRAPGLRPVRRWLGWVPGGSNTT